jgi:hypothetical protein
MIRLSLTVVLFLSVCMVANASMIENCASCAGATYDLTYSTISIGATTDVFNIYVTADTSGYTAGGEYLYAMAPKVSSSVIAFSLLYAPVSYPGGSGWESFAGGLNSGGCDEAGLGYNCTQSTGLGSSLTGDIHKFAWQIILDHGSLFTGPGEASLKAMYVNSQGGFEGPLLSNSGTLTESPVPEPTTFMLFGGGILLIMLGRKRFSGSRSPN